MTKVVMETKGKMTKLQGDGAAGEGGVFCLIAYEDMWKKQNIEAW